MGVKQFEVIITPFAEAALQIYDDYLRLELFSDQAADNLLDLMEKEIKGLSSLPAKYPLVEREPWYSEGIRIRPAKGYNVYFWIDNEHNRVYVIDIINHRMDQDSRLAASTRASTGI